MLDVFTTALACVTCARKGEGRGKSVSRAKGGERGGEGIGSTSRKPMIFTIPPLCKWLHKRDVLLSRRALWGHSRQLSLPLLWIVHEHTFHQCPPSVSNSIQSKPCQVFAGNSCMIREKKALPFPSPSRASGSSLSTTAFRVYNPSSVWRKPLFSTLKKGYIPETSAFLSNHFWHFLIIIFISIQSENIFKCHAFPRNFPFSVQYFPYPTKLKLNWVTITHPLKGPLRGKLNFANSFSQMSVGMCESLQIYRQYVVKPSYFF